MADILVVEDDVHMLRVLSMWLQRNGHAVHEVANGLAGRGQLLVRDFDAIVSDVNMPGMDGISLVRWLRTEKRSQTPVILLSSRSDQAELMKQVEAFGVRVYPKPFSPSRLVVEVERCLAESSGEAMTREETSLGS